MLCRLSGEWQSLLYTNFNLRDWTLAFLVKELFNKVIRFGSKAQKPFPMLEVDVSIGLEHGNGDGRAQPGYLGLFD